MLTKYFGRFFPSALLQATRARAQDTAEADDSQSLIAQLSRARSKHWEKAIRSSKHPYAINNALLEDLVNSEPRGQALFELEGTIDYIYHVS
ncbi:hypothetical protein B7463_g5851, partial [Scytalidium lignicola]